MENEGNVPSIIMIDKGTEENITRLLEGQISFDQFSGLHELSGGKIDPKGSSVLSQARMLHILNLTFKAVQHERIVRKALEYLGTTGHILYLPAEDTSFPYVEAVLKKGRLLMPGEYADMTGSFDGLKILFKQAVMSEDHETVRAIVEKAKTLIPNKAIVLARMSNYTYEQVLDEFMKITGDVDLVDSDQFIDIVATNVPDLMARAECELQLSRELVSMDNLLSMGERQRTPENRTALMNEIIATVEKFHFVQQNNLRSRAYWEAYPEQFNAEDMSRPMVKWKCEGECMTCKHWKNSLARPGPHYGHM